MSTDIKIGWASRDITPERPVMIRGQFELRVSQRVNDRLTATALVVDSGDDHAIVVSIDACGVDEAVIDQCRSGIRTRCPGADPEKLVIGATHTHTAPFAGGTVGLQKESSYLEALRARHPDYMTIEEYTEVLVGGVTDAVCEAWEQRARGSLGWGYSYAVVGENRRVRYFDDRAMMYGSTSGADFSHIEGHVDHGVNLLFTYTGEGVLSGVLVNLACPSQASEGGHDVISADYWHEVREEIRRRYGAGLFVLPQCSAAGDQSPHRQIQTRAEDRMLTLKYGEGLNKSRNYGLRQDIARRIADAVGDAEPAVRKDLRQSIVLKHERHRLDLPHWKITDAEYAEARKQAKVFEQKLREAENEDRLASHVTASESRIGWYGRVIDRYESPPQSIPVHVHVVRLGDVAFVTAPFEYYLDFGDRIKGRSPALQTFLVQLTGSGIGGTGGGYLATKRAAHGCSYGAVPASCRVSPEGGQVIVEHAVATLESMFAKAD